MILIVSSDQDVHARAVLDELQHLGAEADILDLSEFPMGLQLAIRFDDDSADHHFLGGRFGRLPLSECNVVWWRRPQPFGVAPELGTNRVDYSFAYAESQAAFDGLWSTLEDAFWVNPPINDHEAHRKVYQLHVARDVGFDVPETLVTNSPEEAGAFIERHGHDSTVYKAFSGTEEAWRETRVLRKNELRLLDSVRYAPVIFQEYIPADVDLRITVMGDEIFTGAIHSQETEYAVDFRMAMETARMEAFDLPEEIEELIHAFMDRLGLVYGAIDMRLTPDGEYVFLEINPAGQWLFVEEGTGLPMSETFARLLAAHDE